MKTVSSEHVVYAFTERMEPVARVAPGERLLFETEDALGGQVTTEADRLAEIDFDRINPATGPIAVIGAEPGDTLVVRVIAIEPARTGVIVTGPGMGVLGRELERHATRILPVSDGAVHFDGLSLPAAPMIGVIGVAPEDGRYPTGTAHRHGGNMDTREIAGGCTIYLPVGQPEAMLALGDIHAVQADGEVGVSACEVAAQVTVEVDVVKRRRPTWPTLLVADAVYIIVSLPTIEGALEEATRQAVGLLQRARGLSREDATMLASLAVDLGVSQLVDPNKTAKARIPLEVLGRPVVELL